MVENVVLLVEDDDDLRATVGDLLRDEGMNVAEAANGLEAMAWMHAHGRPALVLLDLMMPKMDGLQFRTAQLGDPELASVPVVLMTASAVNQGVLEPSGLDEILRKPVAAAELLSAIHRHL